jgi:geranylgeranyl pyrophosphate synthase
LSLAELEQMHRLKTGALLEASVMLGAMAGSGLLPFKRDHYEAVLAGPSKV